jgi:putative membrane protein
MSKTIGIAVLALTSVMALSGVQAQESKQSKASDMFMKQAMQGDMAEIQVGKLAQEKGGDQQVKDFGQTLVSDHQQNLDKARSLAQTIGMTPPDSVSAGQKATYNKLSKLSGPQFDREFAQHSRTTRRTSRSSNGKARNQGTSPASPRIRCPS